MASILRRLGVILLLVSLISMSLALPAEADSLLWELHNLHPRAVGDVNADGKADAVGFGDDGTYVATSSGVAFNVPTRWVQGFGRTAGGWESYDKYPRTVGDVSGDGKADVVGFGNVGVYVSISTGTGFGTHSLWISAFGYSAGGWTSQDKYPRCVADVNGDGMADVVGFGNSGVYVSLSIGTDFDPSSRWVAAFGYSAGKWTSQRQYPRFVADVNGDGKADVVGFAKTGTYVGLSTGSSFGTPVRWRAEYGYGQGWLNQEFYPRAVGDVNGDGKADVIGCNAKQEIYVSLSTGSAFGTPVLWSAADRTLPWWDSFEEVPRYIGDYNADGKADILGYGVRGLEVMTSNGSSLFNDWTSWLADAMSVRRLQLVGNIFHWTEDVGYVPHVQEDIVQVRVDDGQTTPRTYTVDAQYTDAGWWHAWPAVQSLGQSIDVTLTITNPHGTGEHSSLADTKRALAEGHIFTPTLTASCEKSIWPDWAEYSQYARVLWPGPAYAPFD